MSDRIGRLARLSGSVLCGIAALVAMALPAQADEPSAARPVLHAVRLSTPPVIDGTLDDEAWREPPLPLGPWLSYNPLRGDRIPQETHVWVGYDDRYLYFAFQCDDPEPGRIKTSITRRDNIWNDDWVGLSLDALGSGQQAYHLMVNPSGVQLDMLNSVGSGEDQAPDYVWDSAARVTERGYSVEIRLPLQTIRFRGGTNVRMGVLFWRRVSRLGVSVSSPAIGPATWVFDHHAALMFDRLEPRLTREVIPSVTYSRRRERESASSWLPIDSTGEAGFSGKLGLTPTITLDATVNPDFSQVESDAFQIEVNQRFPVFFSEKRPFFMEGAGLFNVAGGGNGDNSLVTAVHTRRIVDPSVGLKVTGSLGRVIFGTLSAFDEAAGRQIEPGRPGAGDQQRFNVARAQYTLKTSSYVGAIFTDTAFAGARNTVVGADLNYRIDDAQSFNVMALRSASEAPDGTGTHGIASQMNYGYSVKRFEVYSQFEHYDRDFRMDTAFYNRTGFTAGWGYFALSFYPDQKRFAGVRRIVPFVWVQGGRDRVAGGNEQLTVSGVRMHFSRQGFFRIDQSWGREPWQGVEYEAGRTRIFGDVQLTGWLFLSGFTSFGRAIFYDTVSPFAGESIDYSVNVVLQPSPRFNQDTGYQRVDFDRRATGEDVYTLHVVNSRTTYQFSRQLFVRAILRYDSLRRQVLNDLLGSYELRPGTVVFIGYGSLHERLVNPNDPDARPFSHFDTIRRGFFFKASYLHRF